MTSSGSFYCQIAMRRRDVICVYLLSRRWRSGDCNKSNLVGLEERKQQGVTEEKTCTKNQEKKFTRLFFPIFFSPFSSYNVTYNIHIEPIDRNMKNACQRIMDTRGCTHIHTHRHIYFYKYTCT